MLPWWALAIPLLLVGQPWWGALLAAGGLVTLLFFRDPRRRFDGPPGDLLAPADGKVLTVEAIESDLLNGRRLVRVATFLSVFDVHVQRCPAAGEVERTTYTPGAKVAAFRRDAGEVNERLLTLLRLASGERIGVHQIAGLLARRVVGYLAPGDHVERGQHLGLIKFGSRVDLLLPEGFEIRVAPGQRVRAGETVMARRRGA